MFKKDAVKVIEFAPDVDLLDLPKPAKAYVPDWYKKLPQWMHGAKGPNMTNMGVDNHGPKHCVPFLESLTVGYIVELWQDLEVTQTPNGPSFKWPVSPSVMTEREVDARDESPTPAGHHSTHYAWMTPYTFRTPPGYSLLISHPFNRFDLPFTTLAGVVDADKGIGSGKLPFFLKEGFEGIIPAGTPIYQVLPFKRDDWRAELSKPLKSIADKLKWNTFRVTHGYYRKNVWQKKNFD